MKLVLKTQQEIAENSFVTGESFEALRESYNYERKYWNEGGEEVEKIINTSVEGSYGEIPIRLYYPKNHKKECIVFIHGGGFVVGNLDTHDRIMRYLASKSGKVVVGIDYKLSPEYKFPTALEECVEVINYF